MSITTTMENHSGVDGDFASHKSAAIFWRYQKAKGITKRGQHRFWCCPFLFYFISFQRWELSNRHFSQKKSKKRKSTDK